MSTIDPTQIDTSKPPDGSGDPANPVNYASSEERAHKSTVQTQFGNAKTDIEGLEASKADQAALDAHTGDGTIHYTQAAISITPAQAGADPAGSADAVQTNLDAHRGTGGAVEHPVTVVGTPGFAPALSGVATEYLDGSGNFSTPAGGSGEANTQSTPAHTGTNDARLDMTKAGVDLPLKRLVEGANVTLSETADSVTITATPPGGGGGDMLSPVAAVTLGELYSAADTAGVQTQGTGILAADVSGHIADTSGTPHNIGGQITTAINDHENELDPHTGVYLKKVNEDTTPQLGGPLETQGNNILLQDGATTEGVVGALAAQTGAVLAYSDDGTYQLGDGAVTVEPGRVAVYGSTAVIDALQHTVDGGRQVYVAENGSLFAVDPPPVGWSVFDSDAADYENLGTGTGTGAWVNLTGLTVLTPEAVENNQRLDFSVTLFVSNTSNQSGTIDVGFSVNAPGTEPTQPSATVSISAGFVGIVPIAFSTFTTQAYATDADVDVWARRNNGSGPQYAPDLLGTVTPHEFVLSTPGTGGGPGGGDVIQGSGWTDGALLISQSAAGKIAGGTSIQSSNVALLDTGNIFTGTGTQFRENFGLYNSNDVRAGFSITSTFPGSNDTTIAMFPTSGGTDARNFYFEVGGGTARIHSANDIGQQSPERELEVFHQGGTVLGGATGGDRGAGTINTKGVYVDGVQLTPGGSATLNEQHTWAVFGEVSADTYPGMFALIGAGETLSTTRYRARVATGFITVQFVLNNVPIGSPVQLNPTAQDVTLAQALSDGDRIELITSAPTSNPADMMVTLEFTRTA